ncbi:unnamed protein product [Peronospora farinosa]|nr:unnamed protein product [Peronospora farinosa]
MYKYIQKWVRSCETCQRVKPAPSSQAPLRPLPIATEAWRSVSMDFIFGLPPDEQKRTGVLVLVYRFSKKVHFSPVSAHITAGTTAKIFIDLIFRHHGLPESILSDRDPRFTSAFWAELFQLLVTRLLMYTAAHPETDGQTEQFAINNAVHASTGLTPFFVNNARHPRVPALLALSASEHPVSKLGGGVSTDGIAPKLLMIDYDAHKVAADAPNTGNFVDNGKSTPDAMLSIASSVANFAPKENTSPVHGDAYTLDIPTSMRLHPTFYVGRLKAYLPADLPSNLPRSSAAARNPTSLDDDVDDDWDQVLPERREVDAAHYSTAQEPDYENRCPSPEVFRRDAPPPLVDASGVRRWIVDRIVDHEDHKFYAPSNDSAPMKKRVEKHYRVRWLGYSPADDTWEPSSTLFQDVLDVVEDYESRRKTAIASDAADSIPNLASRDAREQQNFDDDSPSDSEIYYEARENLDGICDYVGCHSESNMADVGIEPATSRSRTQW